MTEHDLKYPVLTVSQNIVNIEKNIEKLIKCSSYALSRGFYKNMFIIDSLGAGYRVISANRIDKESIFYNVLECFWSRIITVKLELEKVYDDTPVEKIKHLLHKSFKVEGSWTSGEDFIELETNINKARTTREVIEVLENWIK